MVATGHARSQYASELNCMRMGYLLLLLQICGSHMLFRLRCAFRPAPICIGNSNVSIKQVPTLWVLWSGVETKEACTVQELQTSEPLVYYFCFYEIT